MTSLKGKFKFYEDVVEINFSTKFVYFKETLEKMLGLTDDNFSNIKLSYKDEDGDKIEIKTEEDYKIFFDELKKRSDELIMLAEVKEESNISIQQCSVSILAYVQKNNRGNINNVSEQIKEKNKSLELSDEINPNNISNNEKSKEKIVQPQNNNVISNNLNNNNIINNNNLNNNNLNINQINNNNIINNNNLNNNNLNINQINNNNINQNQNNLNINKVIENNNINRNINNNINNLNNINNINNINNFNNINNKVQQPQNFQQPQNQNRQINDNLYVLSFPYYCQLCKIAPIYQALYYCKECKLTICPKCELSEGQKHIHPFYKIQTTQQFDFLMIENSTGIEKLLDGVSNKLEGAYNSMLGFFGTNNNNNNNRNVKNDPVNQRPQRISLIQLARNYYDLRNFTDQQIETALLKANKNIDEAVIILVSQ